MSDKAPRRRRRWLPEDDLLEALTAYDKLRTEGEAVTADDLDLETDTVDDAITLHRTAVRLRKALQAIESALGVQLAERLGDGGAVRYGDTIYRYGRGWKESVNDPDAFWSMVDQLGVRVSDLFNPNTVRKAALPLAIRDTAFTKTRDDDPKLSAVPRDRAPHFLDHLEDGDYVIGKQESNE